MQGPLPHWALVQVLTHINFQYHKEIWGFMPADKGAFPRAGTNGPCLRGLHPLRVFEPGEYLPRAAGMRSRHVRTSPVPEAIRQSCSGNLPAGSIIELWHG